MAAPDTSLDKGTALAALNARCAQLVAEANALIEEEFQLQETEKQLEHFTKLNAKYDAQVGILEAQLKHLRVTYVGLTTKLNNDTKGKELKKLYTALKKQYEKKARETGLPPPNVRDWKIPQQFPVPRGVEPKIGAERSALSVKMAHKMFKLKYYYRARAYHSVTKAQEHCRQMEQVVQEQLKKQPMRQRAKWNAEHNIANVQDRIELMRLNLAEPMHNIWVDAYQPYAKLASDLLVKLDESTGGSYLTNCEASTFSGTVTGTIPMLTTVRRMSGPDINEMGQTQTQPDYLHQRTDEQCGGPSAEQMFRAPPSVKYSETTVPNVQPKFNSLSRCAHSDLNMPMRPMIPMSEVGSYHLSYNNQVPRVRPRLSKLALSQLKEIPGVKVDDSVPSSDYGDEANVPNRQVFNELAPISFNAQANIQANSKQSVNSINKTSVFDENGAAQLYSPHAVGLAPSPSDYLQGTPNTPIEDCAPLEESFFYSVKNKVSPLRINREPRSQTVCASLVPLHP